MPQPRLRTDKTRARRESKHDDTFEQTIRNAVDDTAEQAKSELAGLRAALHAWETRLDGLDATNLRDKQGAPLDSAAVVVQRLLRRLRGKAGRRARHLDAFNVVLFGRTGTGKSSFVEALSRGDGRRISTDGRLDHTRDVEVRTWRGFSVVDTPGIQGWAESDERRRIETLAQEAVERADVVVLAFDSLNQKVGEFRQVAEWVSRAGKAAIALLNVKDESWRFDERLLPGDTRMLAISQVRGHAEHVRRMLTEIGLPDVPVVALNTQWAVAARAERLKAHPALDELEEAIEEVGRDRLEHASNIGAVTDLLRSAVELDAVALRLGGVRMEIQAVLERFAADLGTHQLAVETELEVDGERLLAGIARTGFEPKPTEARFPDEEDLDGLRSFADLLAEIWPAGHSRLRSKSPPAVEVKLERALRPALSKLRNEAFARAQREIGKAFTGRKAIDGDTIAKRTLTEAQVRRTIDQAVTSVFNDLGEDLVQDAEDAEVALQVKLKALERGFDAGAGSGARWQGRAGGLVSAGVLSFGALTGGLGLIAAGLVGGFFARRRRKKAEQELREERTRFERSVASWLDGVLEDTRVDAVAAAKDVAVVLGARTFLPLAEELVRLTRQRDALRDVANEVRQRRAALTGGTPPQDVISRAKAAVERQRHPHDTDAPDKVWLGEDWLEDPTAAERTEAIPLIVPPIGRDLKLPIVDADAVGEWLAACGARCPQSLTATLQHADELLAAAPQVALVGDYSSGKTSLIRRIGADLGLTTTDGLAVGAGPTTDAVIRIHTPSFVLVDTPGLESERAEDEQTARGALADCALLVVMHSAASGDLSKLLEVVHPVHAPERANRVVHVLARSDALASRPHRDGAAFLRLLKVKRDELRDRLLEKALPCAPELPLPLAADPGGRHQDTDHWEADAFDFHRGWDGLETLLEVLTRLAPTGRPAAAVDLLVTELDAERARERGRIADLEVALKEVRALSRLYERAQRDLRRIERHAASRLRTVVEDLIAERTGGLSELSAGTLETIQSDPERWFLTEELLERLNEWTHEVDAQVRVVYGELGEAVRARTGKPAFQAAKQRTGSGDPLHDFFAETRANAKGLTGAIGKIPKVAERIAKLGPNGGRAFGAVAGVVLEGILQVLEGKAAKRHDKRLQAAIDALRAAGKQWVDDVLTGADGEPGLLDAIRAERSKRIDGAVADRVALMEQTTVRIDNARANCADIETLMNEGRALLAR